VAALKVRVVSPAKVVYQGDAAALVAPAWDGQVGILPGHAPFIALLGAGYLDIDLPGGGSTRYWVGGGALKVLDDQVTVLAELAHEEAPDAIPDGIVPDLDDMLEASRGNPLV
jgi:F-type H+-transporting ATPase subunit epsilon